MDFVGAPRDNLNNRKRQTDSKSLDKHKFTWTKKKRSMLPYISDIDAPFVKGLYI